MKKYISLVITSMAICGTVVLTVIGQQVSFATADVSIGLICNSIEIPPGGNTKALLNIRPATDDGTV
ncbi:MAG: hypothetical protein ACREBC_33120 [Pyrinomonadaceae bacterium]